MSIVTTSPKITVRCLECRRLRQLTNCADNRRRLQIGRDGIYIGTCTICTYSLSPRGPGAGYTIRGEAAPGRPLPAEPTDAPPGSLEKVDVMEQRYRDGVQLYHPDDAPSGTSLEGWTPIAGGRFPRSRVDLLENLENCDDDENAA